MEKEKTSVDSGGCGSPFIIALSIAGTLAFTTKLRNRYIIAFMVMSLLMLYYAIRHLIRKSKKNGAAKKKKPAIAGLGRPGPLKKKEIKTIITLGDYKDPNLVMSLLQSLHSKQKGVPELAYQALLKIKLPAADDPLLQALDDPDAKIVDVAIEVLGGIGDVKPIPRLIKIADAPLHDQEDVHYPHLESTLEKIRQYMAVTDEGYFCSSCFVGYSLHHEKCKTYDDFYYYACRNCGSDAYRIPGVERVILCIDPALKESYTIRDNILHVNWRQLKKPFDFDEIQIKDVQEKDLEELVMILRNDMDDKRRAALSSRRLAISDGINLSAAQRNLIQDNFDLRIEGK